MLSEKKRSALQHVAPQISGRALLMRFS